MSLINQVLQDLDKRKGDKREAKGFSSVHVALSLPDENLLSWQTWVVIACVLITCAVLAFTFYSHRKIKNSVAISAPTHKAGKHYAIAHLKHNKHVAVAKKVREKFVLKPIKKVPVDRTVQEYRKALILIESGHKRSAMKKLIPLVQKRPSFVDARLRLINLKLGFGKAKEAKKLLSAGLKLNATQPDLLLAKAKLLLQAHKAKKALLVMSVAEPDLASHTDFYSTLAALYQRNNKYQSALDTYQELLTVDKDNALWWMGLAIAYDSLGNKNHALEAYQHAQNMGTLKPNLVAFVKARITLLTS